MSLITNQFVKDNFIQYQSYFVDESDTYSETILTNEIALAENHLTEFVAVDATTLTDALTLHLLNIVKYRGFVRRHGDTEFATKPTIVKDYEETIKVLSSIKAGERSLIARPMSDPDQIKVTAKTRLFGNADGSRSWFH